MVSADLQDACLSILLLEVWTTQCQSTWSSAVMYKTCQAVKEVCSIDEGDASLGQVCCIRIRRQRSFLASGRYCPGGGRK